MEYPKNISPDIKERLYRELMHILILLEDGNVSEGKNELEALINRLKFDKL
jgi:hypothetical protein